MSYSQTFHQAMDAVDDITINPAVNPDLNQVIDSGRRDFLKGGLAYGLMGLSGAILNTPLGGCSGSIRRGPLLGFAAIDVQTAPDFDQVIVADGYQAEPFFSWGDAVLAGAPEWQADASDDWRDQLMQAGDNHDGMHYFPFHDQPSAHGLLVINHEYINPTLHPDGFKWQDRKRVPAQVKKEQAAHGLSIIEIKKDQHGQWRRVPDSPYNRRIHAMTPMQISGLLAGNVQMKTRADPSGRVVLGTLNNCSMGVTPWGTYLVCEENWHHYFCNNDEGDYETRISHKRYGVAQGKRSKYYAWESVDPRFNATPDANQPHLGYVHEPNRFGWVVEVDPFDPDSTPVKHTALGRLCRECAVVSVGDDGRMAVYSGDDTKGEYIYKFVPDGVFKEGSRQLNRRLLSEGTLYAAQFRDDGRGRWLALRLGENGLTPDNGFADQASILLNTRAAADRAGATAMDRPEWIAVHPHTREVYVTLTNNDERGDKQPLNKANPRPHNLHGQILRWNEEQADPAATDFEWTVFLLAGEADTAESQAGDIVADNLKGNIIGDIFSSPDGLMFDGDGRLWIETDYDDDAQQNQNMGCNQLLCADPFSREVRRFLVGPRGCEITGITFTPDFRAMWINVQHPGLHYPASDGKSRPRSTTVLITKLDGGVIGA
ncbi:MAG: PhoX family phosphatase [Ketobacter sp.]